MTIPYFLWSTSHQAILGGGDPSPVINWDFLQSQSLTSFSRTSNATLFDSTGKLTYAANNTAVNSAVYNTNWTLAGISSITTGVSDPVGGTAASSMVEDGTTGLHRIYSGASSCFTAVAGVSYLVSLDIKPGTRTWTRLFLGGGPINGGLGVYAYFNLSGSGSVGTSTATSPGIVQLANGWYRAYFKVTAGSAGLTALYIEGATADTVNSYAGSNGATALSVYNLVAAAVTYETTPRSQDQVITTTTPYYGPRYPYAYNGTTWDAQGLLVEAAGTNVITYSQDLSNANWTKSNATIGSSITGPDGLSSLQKLQEDNTTNLHYVRQSFNASAAVYSISVVMKAAERTLGWVYIKDDTSAIAFFDLQNGITKTVSGTLNPVASITNLGGGLYRCSMSITSGVAAGTTGSGFGATTTDGVISYAGTTGSGIYAGFVQVEQADRATSYIPNLATGTTTRNADTSLAFSAISLPTGLSFSRASNAMQYDAAGRLTYAPNNLCIQSNSFTTTWTTSSAMVPATTTAVNDPLGGTSAWTFTEDTSSGYHREYQVLTLATGQSYVVSVYLQNIDARYFNFSLYSGPTDYAAAIFDLVSLAATTGASGTGYSVSDGNVVSVGSGWYRCSFKITLGSASVTVSIGLSNSATISSYGLSATYTGTSRKLYVFGAQIETVTYETLPRPYNATTTTAYYGPRYDYDPLTRLPKGLLIEEGRTNVAPNSETFPNSGFPNWKWNAVTVASASAAPPSGASTVSKLVEDSTNNFHYVNFYPSTVSGTSYTYSVYVKAAERYKVSVFTYMFTGAVAEVNFNLATGTVMSATPNGTNGVTATSVTNVGNGWYRIAISGTSNTTGSGLDAGITLIKDDQTTATSYLGNNTSGIYIWGAQLEAGSFPTSYIPNPGIPSGIRSADISKSTSFGYAASGGTVVSEWFADKGSTNASTYPGAFLLGDATPGSSNGFALRSNDVVLASRNPNYNGATLGSAPAENSINRVAGAYNTSFHVFGSLNGAAVVSTTTNVITPTITTLWLGQQNLAGTSNPDYLNGHIRKFAYYNVKLADAKLQTKSVVGATL